MLTAELRRVRIQKGVLTPSFVDPDDEGLKERADELVALFRDGIGRRRWELEEEIGVIAGDGVDHKLTRGLAKVLLDRSEFATDAPVDPVALRAEVFREAARRGPLGERTIEGGPPTAAELWAEIAARHDRTAAALEENLYADHDDQQVLKAVDVPSAAWLLHRYNVALVQAALVQCVQLRVDLARPTPARARQLVRALKFHQLIYALAPIETAVGSTATPKGPIVTDGYRLAIDGPGSLFSQSTRYGRALARFFPALLLQPGAWTLEADLDWGGRALPMRLSSAQGLRSHYRDTGAYETREAVWFAERFEALGSGWTLQRDAEPIRQGAEGVVVPDFTFLREGRVAHLEILGFWRKGTVPARLALLRRHGPANLVVAVSRRLCGAETEEIPATVIPFTEVIPAREVLRQIEACAI